MLSNKQLLETIAQHGGVWAAIENGVKARDIADLQVGGAWNALAKAKDDYEFFFREFDDLMYRKGEKHGIQNR